MRATPMLLKIYVVGAIGPESKDITI